ncbi:MAG: hypothetical protein M1837_001532 [Sclerophora amabilis]|nr:MAG: hypothetical protein M1837_001532 [Sclerophora amabilis]
MRPSQQLLLFVALCFGALTNALAVTGSTTGINAATGQRPFRKEFRTFQSSGAAFDLYILALQKLQDEPQGNQLSYYQLSGIHGRPYIPWDGVNGEFGGGYCTHGSIIFPPWHRPYLALYEQALTNHAKTIAATFPQDKRARYQAAANTLRIPYWDWALNATMPTKVSEARLYINTPTGMRWVNNPLATYRFHPRPSTADFPAGSVGARYPNTVRYPDANGNSQPNLINQQLARNAADIQDRTYLLLSQQSSYAAFSNTGYRDRSGQTTDSLENLHNGIHSLIGNGGHMSYVPYSGFDPVFFLHHANADHLLAVWQAIHPDSYVTPQVDPFGTRTIRPNSISDVNTPLTPFHRGNGNDFWTSASARSTRAFGYAYEDVVDWGVSKEKLMSDTRAKVKKNYDPDNSLRRRGLSELSRRKVEPLRVDKELKEGDSNLGAYNAWYIKLQVDEYELGQPFFIHFFNGPFPKDNTKLSFAPNLISSFSVFTPQNTTEKEKAIVYGQIPLTRKLVADFDAKLIKDLEPDTIVPYLKANLEWRVQTFDNEAIPTEKLTTLKVHVAHQSVTPSPEKDEFPKYGDYTTHKEITVDKCGGWNGTGDPL